ncbi:MAG: DUF86 domain-containing protein [Euryarchaeota archaeon]|nr:DUF86 domain-containing protein [Euryarchaeota archaeon]
MRKKIIRTKIKEIKENLNLVSNHIPDTFKAFSGMGLVKDGIYKRVEFSIENVFDICALINTDLELGIPRDDRHIVENLTKNGILTKEMGKKLGVMKGFRNIVVHRYGKVNDKLAFRILKENIEDFYDFIEEIEKLL